MGTRFKTFESTGLAPNGRLYAGDLNQLQDVYADQSNYAQQVDVNALSIGESALKLLRYGTGEARISGAMRIDGIFRGLGGVYAGAFTTAQRNAIALGLRPYGLIILNTDAAAAGRLEWNSGTDATPNWQPISDTAGTVPIGTTIEWPWTHTQLPANYLLPYGQAVSRTTYPLLHAIAAASAYPHGNGDGSTTFNLPDYRGRVAVGRDDMGTVAAGRITSGGSGVNGLTLGASGGVQNYGLVAGEMPAHTHTLVAATITGTPALSGSVANGSLAISGLIGSTLSIAGSPALSGVVSHNFTINRTQDVVLGGGNHYHGLDADALYNIGGQSVAVSSGGGLADVGVAGRTTAYAGTGHYIQTQPTFGISGGVNNGNLGVNAGSLALAGSVNNGTLALGGVISNGSLGVNANTLDVGGSTDSTGSGTAHQNVQPSLVVNKAMRVA